MYVSMYVNMYVSMYVCMYVCMYVYVSVCVYVYVCIYICIYIYTYIHICVYLYIPQENDCPREDKRWNEMRIQPQSWTCPPHHVVWKVVPSGVIKRRKSLESMDFIARKIIELYQQWILQQAMSDHQRVYNISIYVFIYIYNILSHENIENMLWNGNFQFIRSTPADPCNDILGPSQIQTPCNSLLAMRSGSRGRWCTPPSEAMGFTPRNGSKWDGSQDGQRRKMPWFF